VPSSPPRKRSRSARRSAASRRGNGRAAVAATERTQPAAEPLAHAWAGTDCRRDVRPNRRSCARPRRRSARMSERPPAARDARSAPHVTRRRIAPGAASRRFSTRRTCSGTSAPRVPDQRQARRQPTFYVRVLWRCRSAAAPRILGGVRVGSSRGVMLRSCRFLSRGWRRRPHRPSPMLEFELPTG
jgi:hypothetical protein